MKNEFTCTSKRLANYLIKNGSKFIEKRKRLFVFENDDSINKNIEAYESTLKKCMF